MNALDAATLAYIRALVDNAPPPPPEAVALFVRTFTTRDSPQASSPAADAA